MQNLQLNEKITQLLSHTFDEIYKDISKRGLLLQYYSNVFEAKDLCASCPGKLREYYQKLKSKFNQNRFIMSNFKLKKDVGVKQMSFGSSEFISNDNITDEKAIEFLKINPNRSILFEVIPENWKELIEGEEKTDADLSLSELREKYPDIKANSQAKFLEKLAASQDVVDKELIEGEETE